MSRRNRIPPMSVEQAREYLAGLGFVPGQHSTGDQGLPAHRANRDGIKVACRVLLDARVTVEPAAVVPVPRLQKKPRQPDEVPGRGDRPSADDATHKARKGSKA